VNSHTVSGAPPVPALTQGPEVMVPTSPAEAISAFGDGAGTTVVGGGTVVTPLLTHGHLWPQRVLMLHAAGLGRIIEDGPLEVGATATLAQLAKVAPEPLAAAARIPDYEIRGQASVGGNLCVGGDLQPALIVLGARVRSAGEPGGLLVEGIEDFLARTGPRLILSVEVERPLAGAYLEQRRRHAHTYPVLTIAVARRTNGVYVSVGRQAERAGAVRCRSVERALAGGASAQDAARAALDDVQPEDDPLASAWYRRRVLPVLMARALSQLEAQRCSS
jgi:CO/xanthine dehydrogenase FAD-binding subunit